MSCNMMNLNTYTRRDTYTAMTHTSAAYIRSSYMDWKFSYTFVLQIKQHNEKKTASQLASPTVGITAASRQTMKLRGSI